MGMQERKRVIVLGAGPAGLGAAYYLSQAGYQVSIIERANCVGGASASFKIKDYIVDYGPHAFHIKKEEIVALVKGLIGDDCHKVRRRSRLILDGKNLEYPLNIKEALLKINPLLSFKIFIDYMSVRIRRVFAKNREFQTFQDWGIDAFGHTLYRLAFGNYSEKMWGVPGFKLSRKLAQQKLLRLNLLKIILKVLGIGDSTLEGGVKEYYDLYPRFGIGTLFEKMQEEILRAENNSIFLNTKIKHISAEGSTLKNICFERNGQEINKEFDYLVSSIPLKYLCEYISINQKDDRLKDLSKQLKYRDIRIIYVVLDKDYFSDVHWFYLLDSCFRFNRLSEQKNLNAESSPPGKTVISLDIACNCGDETWNMPEEEFFRLALNDLKRLGIEESHTIDYFSLKARDIYPVYDLNFDKKLNHILGIIEKYPNLYSLGRQGLFLNNDIHDSIEMGKLCSEFISQGKNSKEWYGYMKNFIHERLEGSASEQGLSDKTS